MFITPSLPSEKFPSPTLNTAQVEPDVVLIPVEATPAGPLELLHDAGSGSGSHLSLADINKVLFFSGMTDAGRFDAIGAITDIDQFLGVFGINYAELKEILALPDDSFKAASGDDAQSPKDIASTAPPEYVAPYPVPKIDYVIMRDVNGLPISSDTAAQEEQLADGSTSLAPQTLDKVHNAALLPPPIDASADAATSSVTSGLADQENPAPLVLAPESPLIQGVLPDGPCTADLPISEAAPVPVPAEDPIQGVLPDTPCSMELPADELLPVPVHAGTDCSTPQEGLDVSPLPAEPNPWTLFGAGAEASDPAQGYDALTRFPYNVVDVGAGTESSTPSPLADIDVGVAESAPAESAPAESAVTLTSQPREISGTLPDHLQIALDDSLSAPVQDNPINSLDPHEAGGDPASIPVTPASDSHDDDHDTPLTAASSTGGIEMSMKLGEEAPVRGDFSNPAAVLPNENGNEPSVNEPFDYVEDDVEVDPGSGARFADTLEMVDRDTARMFPFRSNTGPVNVPRWETYTHGNVTMWQDARGTLHIRGGGIQAMSYVNFPGVANVVVDGTSAVTKVLAGVGAGTVAGGIGLGIWAAADTDGFRDAFTRESNSPAAPDPHDPPATPVTSTIDSLAPVAPDPELTPLPLTNVDAPAANPGALASAETPATAIPQPSLSVSPSAFSPTPQPFAVPDSAASPAIADTPVTLLVALSEHGGISFADVAGDLPAIRAILAQWISNAAPDYPLALQGLDIADFGDGSGLSLMVYLNAYVDPSTAFNSALTPESAATLQSAVQHQVDNWLYGAVPEIALVATSTTPIMH